jgi:hypothetical protein
MSSTYDKIKPNTENMGRNLATVKLMNAELTELPLQSKINKLRHKEFLGFWTLSIVRCLKDG